jgi:hypothetical protein
MGATLKLRWQMRKIITRQCRALLVFNYSNAVRTESSRRLSLRVSRAEEYSRYALNIAEKEQPHEMQRLLLLRRESRESHCYVKKRLCFWPTKNKNDCATIIL